MIQDKTVSSDKIVINAPVELVWEVLLDFDRYPDWNTFCPQILNTSLEPGATVDMMVDMGNGPAQQVEYITRVESLRCIAWGMANQPQDPIHAERSQYLERISETSCSYISVDEFGGSGIDEALPQFAAAVEAGFNRCARDLKARAEKLFRQPQAES